MHLCEALLTAFAATGRAELAQRARRLVEKFVEGYAREHDWLLPEHYEPGWRPLLEYNDDRSTTRSGPTARRSGTRWSGHGSRSAPGWPPASWTPS